MRMLRGASAGVLLMVTIGCSQPAQTGETAGDEAAIDALRQRESELVAQGNADSLMTVYTDDVVFLPANEPVVEGKAAARRWAEATFGQVTLAPSYTSSQVMVLGDWAIDRYAGTLTVTSKADSVRMIEQIKGIHILRKGADGSWRIAHDIWNSDAPPPPPPAPATRP